MNDLSTSLVRTWTPIVVGSVLGWLASAGVNLDPSATAGLTAFLTGLFSALYYLGARLLERRYPAAGKLLGTARQVTYEPKL